MKDRNKSADRGRKEGNFCFRRELKTITIKSTSDGPAFHVWSYSTAPVSGCFARKTSVPTGIIFSLTHHYLSTTPHQMCFFLFYEIISFACTSSQYVCVYVCIDGMYVRIDDKTPAKRFCFAWYTVFRQSSQNY